MTRAKPTCRDALVDPEGHRVLDRALDDVAGDVGGPVGAGEKPVDELAVEPRRVGRDREIAARPVHAVLRFYPMLWPSISMHDTVALPLWLVVVLVLLAAWAALDRLLLPSVRWVLRRRVNRVLEEHQHAAEDPDPALQADQARGPDRPAALRPAGPAGRRGRAPAREEMPREVAMRAGPSGTRARSSRRSTPTRTSASAIGSRATSRARSTGCASATPTRRGWPRSAPRRPSSSSSTTAATWTTSSCRTSPPRRPRSRTPSASGPVIWPLQTLIRAMGAYFVRRNSKDPLYRKVLERYVAMATAAGVTQAVFPEGGLSRDGKLRPPQARHPRLHAALLRPGGPSGTSRSCRSGSTTTGCSRTGASLRELDVAAIGPGWRGRLANTCALRLREPVGCIARNRWHRFGYACVNFGSPRVAQGVRSARGVDFRNLSPRGAARAGVEELARGADARRSPA